MKRFVDMKVVDEVYDHDFAWFDTVVDRFEMFNDEMVWENWVEFETDIRKDLSGFELESNISKWVERYRELCPRWVFEEKEGT